MVNIVLRVIKFGFVGFIIGYILTLLLGNWIWLDMRVNFAIIIPIIILLSIGLALWNQCLNSKKWLWIPEILVCVIFLIQYWGRLDAIAVIPGIILREAFHLDFITLESANLILMLVLFLGNFIWLFNTSCLITEIKSIKGSEVTE